MRNDHQAQAASRIWLTKIAWWVASIALFTAIWELSWFFGLANPLILPPPHAFLRDFAGQGKYFDPSIRMRDAADWEIALAVLKTVAFSTARVLAGLFLGFIASLIVGVAIRYFRIFGKLAFPIINMLAPISPIAWLPIAIFAFGIGNVAAIFLVVITLFFMMTIATVNQIDLVKATPINVARTMGARRTQMFSKVVIPSILPSLFTTLRVNLFAAWMIVLIAELIGVSNGLGQVIMISRNTFNANLTLFAITTIGITGFLLDYFMVYVQRRFFDWNATQV